MCFFLNAPGLQNVRRQACERCACNYKAKAGRGTELHKTVIKWTKKPYNEDVMLSQVPFMYLWSRKRLHYTELGNASVWDLILNKKPAWSQYVGLTAVDKTFTVLGSDYSEDEAPALFSKPQSGCSLHCFFFIRLSGDRCLQRNTRPRQMFVPVKNEKDKG